MSVSSVSRHSPAQYRVASPVGSLEFPNWFRIGREVGIVALAALIYFCARGLIHARADQAVDNANWLVSFERSIGVFREQTFQSWIVGRDWLTDLANAIYIYGHWPVVILTLSWLLIRHREMFGVYRSAMLISGAIGVVCFVTFPMAPPRFLPDLGFIDTVTLHSEAYRVLQPPSLTNQYAAMPSLHVGWNLLMGIAIVTQTNSRFWKLFGVVMPLLMYLATIVTANHYFADGVAGATIALVGLAIAWHMQASRREPDVSPFAARVPVTPPRR